MPEMTETQEMIAMALTLAIFLGIPIFKMLNYKPKSQVQEN